MTIDVLSKDSIRPLVQETRINLESAPTPDRLLSARANSEEQYQVKSASEKEDMVKYISEVESFSTIINRQIKFQVDHKHETYFVKIIDKDTNEVIRQLPTEEMRKLHKRIQESIELLGLLVDEKA